MKPLAGFKFQVPSSNLTPTITPVMCHLCISPMMTLLYAEFRLRGMSAFLGPWLGWRTPYVVRKFPRVISTPGPNTTRQDSHQGYLDL